MATPNNPNPALRNGEILCPLTESKGVLRKDVATMSGRAFMELLEYSAETDTASITMPVRDLFTISSIMLGLLATFDFQDPAILSADQERVQELRDRTSMLLHQIGEVRGRR